MALCGSQNCGCAIRSDTLTVTGSGTGTDPWNIGLTTAAPFDWAYRFANATQRDATLIAPTDGMLAYLTDLHTAWRYDGTSWKFVWSPDMVLRNNFSVGANDDAPSTPEAQWLSTGVTIPAWVKNGRVELHLTNIDSSVAASAVTYDLRIRLGGVIQGTVCRVQNNGSVTETYSWNADIPLPATGAQNLEIWAARVSGTALLRFATTSRMWYTIYWS